MTKIDGLEIVMTKNIKNEIDKEIKKRFGEIKKFAEAERRIEMNEMKPYLRKQLVDAGLIDKDFTEANLLLRSAYEIAKRKGQEVPFEAVIPAPEKVETRLIEFPYQPKGECRWRDTALQISKLHGEAEADAERLANEYTKTLKEIGGVYWEEPEEISPALILHKMRKGR